MEVAGQPAGGDAQDPGVPAVVPLHQHRRQLAAPVDAPSGLLHHPPLLALALPVQAVELAGQGVAVVGVAAQ